MSILGIGVDLCEIERVDASLQQLGERFATKILHPNEKRQFDAHRFQGRYLAKRFAAKEAFAKALGTGIAGGVVLPDIEVANDAQGKPELHLHGEAARQLKRHGDCRVHLSISDEKHYAIAQVVIELVSKDSV